MMNKTKDVKMTTDNGGNGEMGASSGGKIINTRLAQSFKIDFKVTQDDINEILKNNQDFYYGISTFEFNIFEFVRTVGRNM